MQSKFSLQDVYQEDQLDDDFDNISEDDLIKALPNQASTKLADIIISFRYLGLYKDLSILAMEELSKRRSSGDSFQFESYIEDNLKSLPKLDFKKPDIENILKKFK